MIFTELRFFIFFAFIFAVYWALKSNNLRKWLLLIASYVFYGAWDWRFMLLLFFVSFIAFAAVWVIDRTENLGTRKCAATLSIVTSLCVLGVFKYFNFFVDSFADIANVVGLSVSNVTLSIVLPVGISFYTFQAISFVVDSMRGTVEKRRSFLDVLLYIGFFPQLVAGPIVRAADFLPQLKTTRSFGTIPWRACLFIFVLGFFKKTGIADNIAPYVDRIFANPEKWDSYSIVMGTVLYSIQIYCDFSGYSDMAIATAGMLGFWIPQNFNYPYFSSNIKQFWRRWHISLSSWLKDYLYIALGGNRKGKLRTYVNLALTMILGGLWHGASYNFIIWGVLHGAALALHRFAEEKFGARKAVSVVWTVMGIAATYYLVLVAWIFFRAENLGSALVIAESFIFLNGDGHRTLAYGFIPAVVLLGLVHFVCYKYQLPRRLMTLKPAGFTAMISSLTIFTLLMKSTENTAFIYFQF